MDRELFLSWFQKVFLPNCGSERPIVLVMDNHDSHYSYELMELAKSNHLLQHAIDKELRCDKLHE